MKNCLLDINKVQYTFGVDLIDKTSVDFATEVLKGISDLYSNWGFEMFSGECCLCSSNKLLLITFNNEENDLIGSFLYSTNDISLYPFDAVRSYYLKSYKLDVIEICIEPYKLCKSYFILNN